MVGRAVPGLSGVEVTDDAEAVGLAQIAGDELVAFAARCPSYSITASRRPARRPAGF
jgi:hypothetical protein